MSTAPDRPGIRVDPVEEAVAALAAGRHVVVLDGPDREDEGDLVLAAELATPAAVALVVRRTSGLLCAPLAPEVADRLELPLMGAGTRRAAGDAQGTAYTVTVDAVAGTTTGISAADRARTLRVLSDPAATPDDLRRPGHVLPLRARAGGVRERPGHTEAAVDLCRLAGLAPAALIAELVDDDDPDGGMLRGQGCRDFADAHGLPLVTIAQLAEHLAAVGAPQAVPTERGAVVAGAVASLPTASGRFTARVFVEPATGLEHLALVPEGPDGEVRELPAEDVLVRVHSECLTGDALGSRRCDCGPQLRASLAAVAAEGAGVVVYVRGHEGRGIGLAAKVAAYAEQDAGADTVEANLRLGLPVDARRYGAPAAVLRALGVRSARLLTNNPEKEEGVAEHGVVVSGRVPLVVPAGPEARRYLEVKRDRMGHLLPLGAGKGTAEGTSGDAA
ncbi:3,4-dihydroxy-2-butanone-4-phosphate synthase [Pseudokineococcus basanitobsidens]|uniref:GTP cyclohydrolase-2 n=1 Tax=Pseudokineococcus basanitobsidens TaxID=1926649 RepID=A0ABU8RLA9_9ACTN